MEFTFIEFLKYDYPSILLVLGLIVLMIVRNIINRASNSYLVLFCFLMA